MNDCGKSDGRVVPAKPPNNAGVPVAEAVEERRPAEGNAASKTRPGRRAGLDAPSALDRVRYRAQQEKGTQFTALLHHVSVDRLRAAYRAINPRAVVRDGRHDRSGAVHAECGDDPLGDVRRPDRDAVTSCDTGGEQRACGVTGGVAQLREREARALVDECFAIAELRGRALDNARDRLGERFGHDRYSIRR